MIKHRGRQEGLGGRWVASGRPTARRPRLVADHPTLRGGRHGRQAAAGRHDLRSRPGPAPHPIDDGRRPTFRRPSRPSRPAPAAGPTWQVRLRRIFQISGRDGEPDLRAAAGDTEGAGRRRWMPPRSPVGSRWCGLAVSELVGDTPTPRRRCGCPAGGTEASRGQGVIRACRSCGLGLALTIPAHGSS